MATSLRPAGSRTLLEGAFSLFFFYIVLCVFSADDSLKGRGEVGQIQPSANSVQCFSFGGREDEATRKCEDWDRMEGKEGRFGQRKNEKKRGVNGFE